MRRPSRLLLISAVAVAALAPVAASAADWPQFHRDAARTGAATGPEPAYSVAWSQAFAPGGPGDRFGLSAPIVVDGLVIAVGPEEVVAFDLETGAPAWERERELGPSVPAAAAGTGDGDLLVFTEGWGDGPPPAAGATPTPSVTPSISDTPSPSASPTDGADDGFAGPSRLVAIDADSGRRRWAVDLPQVSRTGVTIADDLAIVGTNDGTVTAVEVGTGDVAWTADAGRNVEQAIAAADGIAVVSVRGGETTPGSLVGLGLADGDEAWRYEPAVPVLLMSTPAISGDTVVSALSDGTVHGVALADGASRWIGRVNGAAPWAPPAVNADRAFVVNLAGQVYAFDVATGDRIWDHARNVTVFPAPPIVVGSAVVIGTSEGQIVVFDADGDAVWHRDLGEGSIHGLASSGEVLVVVRGGADAGVVALTHDPGGALLDERSPTVVEPVRILGNWALAAIPIAVVLVLIGRLLTTRMAPPDLPGHGDADPDAMADVHEEGST